MILLRELVVVFWLQIGYWRFTNWDPVQFRVAILAADPPDHAFCFSFFVTLDECSNTMRNPWGRWLVPPIGF